MWRLHTGRSIASGRSECETCHHQLGVVDLVPIVGWLVLRGACRHCGARISALAPILEAVLAGLFVVSYLRWPFGFASTAAVGSFVLWLVYLVMLAALVTYDLRYRQLPDRFLLPLILLALVDAGLRVGFERPFTVDAYGWHVLGGAAVLGGVYAVLYAVSSGRWVGLGDVKLGVFAGVVLGWHGALLVLFVSNVLGAVVVVPGLATGRVSRESRIPLGPFLAIGFVIVGFLVPR